MTTAEMTTETGSEFKNSFYFTLGCSWRRRWTLCGVRIILRVQALGPEAREPDVGHRHLVGVVRIRKESHVPFDLSETDSVHDGVETWHHFLWYDTVDQTVDGSAHMLHGINGGVHNGVDEQFT